MEELEYTSFQLLDENGEWLGSVVAQTIEQVQCVLIANNVQSCSINEVGTTQDFSYQLHEVGKHTA